MAKEAHVIQPLLSSLTSTSAAPLPHSTSVFPLEYKKPTLSIRPLPWLVLFPGTFFLSSLHGQKLTISFPA